jgi:hypothetical protein
MTPPAAAPHGPNFAPAAAPLSGPERGLLPASLHLLHLQRLTLRRCLNRHRLGGRCGQSRRERIGLGERTERARSHACVRCAPLAGDAGERLLALTLRLGESLNFGHVCAESDHVLASVVGTLSRPTLTPHSRVNISSCQPVHTSGIAVLGTYSLILTEMLSHF